MSRAWSRPVGGTERAWIVADDLYPPFVNQLVLEGEGSLDPAVWTDAVAVAAAANPGVRSVLRGWVCRARWVDSGVTPPVTVVDGADWDGTRPDGAPFLMRRLDVRRGPSCEVLLVRGAVPRVIVRTHHAVTDGGGVLAFAADVFRVLRGEAPIGHADTVFEGELARTLTTAPAAPPTDDALAPTGQPVAGPTGVVWRRLALGAAGPALAGRVAAVLAAEARRHGVGPVRVAFPADLRRELPDLRSTANLTGLVVLEVGEGEEGARVHERLRTALEQGGAAAAVLGADAVRHVPLGLARAVARAGAKKAARGQYAHTAVVSNLGRLDVDALSGGPWRTRSACFVPPGTPVTAAFVAMWGTPGGVELAIAIPAALATGGRLDALISALGTEFRSPAD